MSKKISEYGHTLLKELEGDRRDFRGKKIDANEAKTIAIMANSTSRVMKETLNSRKFEVALSS